MTVSVGLGLGICALIMVAFVLPGALLLWRGFRSPRLGDEPRCRKCEYNLTGLESQRCPECGSDLTGVGSVVRGQRRWRPLLIVAGVLFLALSAPPAVLTVQKIPWYSLMPTSWLIHCLDTPKPNTFSKAWTELQRRDSAGSLSPSAQRRLITRGLVEQGLPAGAPLHAELIDYVAQALVDGLLSEAEVRQFVEQVAILDLAVRKQVVVGDRVPYWITNALRCPCEVGLRVRIEVMAAAVDGLLIQGAGGGSGTCGVGGAGGSGSSVVYDTPGQHTLTLTVRVALTEDEEEEPRSGKLYGDWQVALHDEFAVLEEEPPDLVRAIDDPELTSTIRESITLNDVTYRGGYFYVRVHADSIPVPIAFDVWLRTADGEEQLGSMALRSAPFGHSHAMGEMLPRDSVGDTCTIILRGSEHAAKDTVDMYEYWDGELVYKDVPVERPEE